VPDRPHLLRRIDALLIVVLAALLVPAVAINAILWRERLQGVALFDPSVGGDPAWRARPLFAPITVAAAVAVRLAAARGRWPLGRPFARAYAIVLGIAILTAAAALLPEPSVFSR
jgi:hypothetical protein